MSDSVVLSTNWPEYHSPSYTHSIGNEWIGYNSTRSEAISEHNINNEYFIQTTEPMDDDFVEEPDNEQSPQVPDSGLIFVRADDMLSRASMAITKQPYSTIGFFYKSSATGNERINIILVDVCRFVKPNWLGEGATLGDLVKNPLVSSISIKGLRPVKNADGTINQKATTELQSKFRTAIGQVIGNQPETSMEETIAQIFGYEVKCPTKGVTAIEMVNWVIMAIGMWDKVPQDGSLSAEALRLIKIPDTLACDYKAKIQMVQNLAANFNQQEVSQPNIANKLMQSYIVENELFDDMIKITLPDRDPNEVRDAQETSSRLNAGYISAMVGKFMDMLINDQEFFKTTLDGFNQNRLMEVSIKDSFRQSLLDIADDSDQLAKLMISWIETGEISYERLMNILATINENKEKISKRHQMTFTTPLKLPIIDNSKLLLLEKNRLHIKTRDTHGGRVCNLVGAYMVLRQQLAQLAKEIPEVDHPIVDINNLLRPLNDMAQSMGLNVKPIPYLPEKYSVPAIINVNSEPAEAIPLQLKDGRQITLTLVNPDLSNLDKGTLVEILESLDCTVSADYKFDNLRKLITERLAS